MARTTKPLTHTEINKAKPKDKVYSLADGVGLHLRINPSGSKKWIFDYYRPYTKVRTSLCFGAYPRVSLAEARQHRDNARSQLAKHIDLKEHREEQHLRHEVAHNSTLERIAAQWLEVKKSKV